MRSYMSKPIRTFRASRVAVITASLVCATAIAMLERSPAAFATQTPPTAGIGGVASTYPEYVLGPQDKVRIKVFAWRPARDEVYEWKAINDVYSVGASGQISLPLIGEVMAGGLTLRQASAAIADQLKLSLGLVDAPSASIEIVEFRPFFILGVVQKPGAYSYRPGLTIVQALSIAGGLLRFNEFESAQMNRANITTVGERGVIDAEYKSTLAKRARLEAELNGTATITFPEEIDDRSPVRAEEERIFDSRRNAFANRMKQIARSREVLETQQITLSKAVNDHEGYVKAAHSDLSHFDELYQKKLTTTSRRAEAARQLMSVEAEATRMQSSLVSVRQELNKLESEERTLRDDLQSQTVAEIRQVQARLDELKKRIQTADTLASQGDTLHLSGQPGMRKPVPVYTIIRQVNGQYTEITASETTMLLPDDTIKVEPPSAGQISTDPTTGGGTSSGALPAPTKVTYGVQ